MIFLICARGGSKGIKNKNIKKIYGKSLVERAINFAKKFNKNIYLSTENDKIKNEGLKKNINIIHRPKILANDKSSEILVWRHFVKYLKKKKIKNSFFISLPPTSPLRSIKTVKKAINHFKKNNFDLVVVINKSRKSPYFNIVKKNKDKLQIFSKKKKFIRRQDVPDTFEITTIAYVVNSKFILSQKPKNIFDGKVGFVETKNIIETIDIDDNYDFKLAKFFLKKK